MRQRLIIHIGTHKTGTTMLQRFLNEHRAQNLDQFGLYYPTAGTQRSSRHTLLATAIRSCRTRKGSSRMSTAAKTIDRMTADIGRSGAVTAIISAEGLGGPRPEFAEACQAFSRHFDVAIVIVLRRQDRFVESLHSQFVRDRGETRRLDEFVMAEQIRSWLDYRRTLSFWESAFGQSAIHVIPYEAAILEQGLLQTFFSLLSLPPPVTQPKPRHVSPGRESVEVLRHINRETGLIGMNPAHRRKRRCILAAMRTLNIDSGCTDVLGTDSRRRLLQTFAEGNAEIASQYLGRADGRLFAEDDLELAQPAADWRLPQSDLIGHLSRLASHFAGAPTSLGRRVQNRKQPTRNARRNNKAGGRKAPNGPQSDVDDNHHPRQGHRRTGRRSTPAKAGD